MAKTLKIEGEIDTKITEKAASSIVVAAGKIPKVTNDVEALAATGVLGKIKTALDTMEEERKSWVKPLNDYVKRINDRFRDIREPLETAKNALSFALLEFKRREEARNTRMIEKAQEKGIPAAREAISVTPQTTFSTQTAQTVISKGPWAYEVEDIARVPRTFLAIDHAKVMQEVREKGRDTKIPGLRFFQRDIVSVRKVEPNIGG